MTELERPGKDPKYKRILLKISGEALMGSSEYGIDMPTCLRFAQEISDACEATGAEICLVIGGGNIFAGLPARRMGWSVHRPIQWA